MPLESKHFYEFKNFCLDTGERILLRDDKRLPVTPKVFHLLKFLIENRGRIIEKEELMREIWAESFVEEGNLTFTVRQLRKALGDDAHEPKFVETVPRRGYRFIAEVKEVSAADFHEQENLKKLSSSGSIAKSNLEISPDSNSSDKKPAETSSPSSFLMNLRPVLYSTVAILVGIFLLSGFLFLKNQTSLLQRFKTSTDPSF